MERAAVDALRPRHWDQATLPAGIAMQARLRRRALTVPEILRWADAYHGTTGRWPSATSGDIAGAVGETWVGVDRALRDGLRGLTGGSSLAQLLARERDARNIHGLADLTEEGILAWADEYHRQTGTWPTAKSVPSADEGREKWAGLDQALRTGSRGLPGGSSLAKLLAERRGVRNRKGLPALTEETILEWADRHHERTGAWPRQTSGPVDVAAAETWMAVDVALRQGRRGLLGGSSLALLLAERRDVRNRWTLPDLCVGQILTWADEHHGRVGAWPHAGSGPVAAAPGETWAAVNHAMVRGARGLTGGYSLAEMLAVDRGARNRVVAPALSRRQILAWADAHLRRTGRWPTRDSGDVPEAPGDTWKALDQALRNGSRGLLAGSSLARLLARHRNRCNVRELPPLSQKTVLAWADEHRQRTGAWPTRGSGAVAEAPAERWDLIDNALRNGARGLAGGTSLARLLAKKRGARNPMCLPPLSEALILEWAQEHYRRAGTWPQYTSGPVTALDGETWAGIDSALRHGKRGLRPGGSLARLLVACLKPQTGETQPRQQGGQQRGDGHPPNQACAQAST